MKSGKYEGGIKEVWIHAAFCVHCGVPNIILYLSETHIELVIGKEICEILETYDKLF